MNDKEKEKKNEKLTLDDLKSGIETEDMGKLFNDKGLSLEQFADDFRLWRDTIVDKGLKKKDLRAFRDFLKELGTVRQWRKESTQLGGMANTPIQVTLQTFDKDEDHNI